MNAASPESLASPSSQEQVNPTVQDSATPASYVPSYKRDDFTASAEAQRIIDELWPTKPQAVAVVAQGLITPGKKTTEFWICLGLLAITEGQSLFGHVSPDLALKYGTYLALAYLGQRFLLKSISSIRTAATGAQPK